MSLPLRPTATLGRLVPWVSELARTAPGLVRAFGPVRNELDPRTHEQLAVVVAAASDSTLTVWIHESWRDFLGGEPEHPEAAVVLAWARRSALEGTPGDSGELSWHLAPGAVRAVRAVVAASAVSSLVTNSSQDWWERLTNPSWPRLEARLDLAEVGAGVGRSATEAALVLGALPVLVPLTASAGLMRVATRLAPAIPAVRTPPEGDDNLAVHLLRELVPQALGHALVRTLVLAWPRPLVVGVRAGLAEATVRVSRRQVEIAEGIGDDAGVVLEGLVDVLSAIGARRLGRDLSELDPAGPAET